MKINFLERWRFGFLLLMILCALVFEPILFGPRAASWIFDIVYSSILVSAVFAVSEHRRGRFWFVLVGVFTLSATWFYHLVPRQLFESALAIHHVVGIGFLFLIVAMTLKGLFLAREISLDIVFGTMAGYLLLGVGWALIYSLLHLANPDAFEVGPHLLQFTASFDSRFSVFIYYSFVTLTTLGYGDMTPVSQTARTLSWLEAAAGQFYLATLVAGIVGIIVSGNTERRARQMPEIVETARPGKKRKG